MLRRQKNLKNQNELDGRFTYLLDQIELDDDAKNIKTKIDELQKRNSKNGVIYE